MPDIASGQSADAINRAVALLNVGCLIGLPTETVYGIAADADNAQAVSKIFAAKGRPADHPLIVHLGADEMLTHYASDIPDTAWALSEAFWPGPLTLILKKAKNVPDVVTGGQDTVGIRIPGHPVALALLRAFAESRQQGGGLAAPSANRFGRISPTAAQHVANELGDAVSLILDGGDCQVGIESTILDLSRGKPEILRPGAITAEQLSMVLGQPVSIRGVDGSDAPRVSGSLDSHYAPLTPLQVLEGRVIEQMLQGSENYAAILRDCPNLNKSIKQNPNVIILANEPVAYAHDFYRVLRDLDEGGYIKILVQELPATIGWTAIQDRLRRAAHRDLPDNG